jgi:putative DNA primase/helicase
MIYYKKARLIMSENEVRAAFDAAETIARDVADLPDVADAPDGVDDYDAPEDGDDFMGEDPPPAFGAFEDEPAANAAMYALNDYGNGQRLIEYFGDDIRFVPRLGWYRWDARRWLPDEDELDVRRDAQKIGGLIDLEVPYIALPDWQRDALLLWLDCKKEFNNLDGMAIGDRTDEEKTRLDALRVISLNGKHAEKTVSDLRKAHRGHAKNSGNTNRISSMLLEARTSVVIPVKSLNADPLVVNCENGVLKFHQVVDPLDASFGDDRPKWRVDLIDHDRGQMISKMCEAPYIPGAPAPSWYRFLAKIQPDPEMRAFLQRWFGYCMTGLTVEQKLAFFFGSGRNGKSTIVEIIARIMADYGTTIPIESLTGTEQRKGSDATPDLVRLPGARFVRASEPEEGKQMKEALIKSLTGGEAIMIRRMQKEFVEITPEFKLTISGNYKPDIRGGDDGIWRRVLLIDFAEQIAKADVDRGLPGKLWEERAGILDWMVQGCLDYLEGGLREPASVIDATAAYRKESDPYRAFLEEECEITGNPADFITGRNFNDAFNAWRLANAKDAYGMRTISNKMLQRSTTIFGLAPDGKTERRFSHGKVSDTGWRGLVVSEIALNRVALYGEEMRMSAARKG